MAETFTQVVILAEDLRQANLIYRYLKRVGYNPHQLIKRIAPKGRGSGEQYVRETYPAEIQVQRQRAARVSCGLAVLVDADNLTVQQRHAQLSDALAGARLDERQAAERVAVLIPKRHIETWVFCLPGEQVNETESYRAREVEKQRMQAASESLFEWTRRNAAQPNWCTDSLDRAIAGGEFSRLERNLQ